MSRYLPSLSTLISPNDLLESLGFLQNAAENIFDDIYFDNYHVYSSKWGEEKEYNLDIIIDKKLGFEIFGTGMSLLLNPPNINGIQEESWFNVSFQYRFAILRFINNFKLEQFPFTNESLVSTLLNACGIEPASLLEHISIHIKNPTGTSLSFIIYSEKELVDFFNSYYELTGTSHQLIYTDTTSFQDIETALAAADITTADVINDFAISTDYPTGEDTIEDVYARLNMERDGGALSIAALIETLNTDYSLIGTIHEIIYIQEPETTYDEILEALNDAGVTLVQLIIDYIIADVQSLKDIENLIIDFFVESKEDSYGTEFYDFFNPMLAASINDLSLALEFPRTWLQPIDPSTDEPYEDESIKSILHFNVGALKFSTENGLEFENENDISFGKSMIGNTGLTLMFDKMKLDLSRTKNIPEADAAGYPVDFVGVFVEKAEIGLPQKWFNQTDSNSTLGIFGENLLLGTGGISGTFGLRAIDGSLPADNAELLFRIGGEDSQFIIGFRYFDLVMQQGAFVSSRIGGSLQLPGLIDKNGAPAKIEVTVSIGNDGDFLITAAENDGFNKFGIENVFDITLQSVSVGRSNERFFVSLSGAIDILAKSGGNSLFKDPLNIDQLVIWDDGSMELKALDGTFKLQKPIEMKLGPSAITVTALHLGSDEREHNGLMRKYLYFGFDGGININPGGIDARGDGIKLYFTIDNNTAAGRKLHVFFRIQSLAIDLIIPGNASATDAIALISGYLAMKEPSPSNTSPNKGTEYIGGISLSLPKIGLAASASMRLNPSVPSFLVDTNLELPMPIPLGPTGVGIYGFRGLLGQKYVTSREEAQLPPDASWYEYYKAKVAPDYREGIQVSKFANADGFSVGAGASIATAFDGGYTFSSKVMVLLSAPNELLIVGQAAIMRQRIGLDTTNDPPFSVMIGISAEAIEASFGVDMEIPANNGKIARVSGAAEMAFFFANSGAWYINIGRNQPEDKRIQAKILTLFNAYAYFMISKKGFMTGAGAKWEFSRSLGPLSISAGAYLDLSGSLSINPMQIGGGIALGGHAFIGIWKLQLGLALDAYLAAEAPKPFIISGGLAFTLKLPWPLKKLGGPYKLDFNWSFNTDVDKTPIGLLEPNKVKAINRMTGEVFPVCYSSDGVLTDKIKSEIESYIIPVDSFIDVEFLKNIGLGNGKGLSKLDFDGQGSYHIEYIPPQKGKSQQVRHEFLLSDIAFEYRNGNNWVEYDVYEAIKPDFSEYTDSEVQMPDRTNDMKYGYLQSETQGKYNKLRIFSQSPLSYLTHAVAGNTPAPEDFGYSEGFLFCEAERKTKTSIDFPDTSTVFDKGTSLWHQHAFVRALDADGIVYAVPNTFSLANALSFEGRLELFFAEPQAIVDLRIGSYADRVRIKFFSMEEKEEKGFAGLPQFEYVEISEKLFEPTALGATKTISYTYNDFDGREVNKITIESEGGIQNKSRITNELSQRIEKETKPDKLLTEHSTAYYGQSQLFGVCMLNIVDDSYNRHTKTSAQTAEDNAVMNKSFTSVLQPIWRPDTIYRIQIDTVDKVNETNHKESHYFIFKTAGPIGHFHKYKVNNELKYRDDYANLIKTDSEDGYRLATLKDYIDFSRSYPNADGRLTNAKPMFYSEPELLVFYKQNYVHTMFNNFADYGTESSKIKSELHVLIKEPTETVIPTAVSMWGQNPDPMHTREVQMINNLVDGEGRNCSGYNIMTPLAVVQKIHTENNLKPDKLYTAVFNATYKAPSDEEEDTSLVHSYGFKTSQYADFEAQIQSCCLLNEDGEQIGQAVYPLEKPFATADMERVNAVFNNTLPDKDPLITEYADKFDRLLSGALKVNVLPPATVTEFNIIRNINSGNIIGILVRNPEPFNDPKIPSADLSDTIELSTLNGIQAIDYKVVFSKDQTQAFVSNTMLNIPAKTAKFTFRYKQYGIYEEDGKEKLGYATRETEEVVFDL